MEIRWYGQSAFSLKGTRHNVFIDPFVMGDMMPPGMKFAYPPIEHDSADLLLITHEHFDHSGASALKDAKETVRSTAGTFQTALGDVVAVSSEHDDAAGTRRGPNTVFVFELDGVRVCHMGDFGQAALRPEQRQAMGRVDLLMVPVGGGPTVGAKGAAELVSALKPRWVLPMHYRTPAISFLEPADAFLTLFSDVKQVEGSSFNLEDMDGGPERPQVIVPAPPLK